MTTSSYPGLASPGFIEAGIDSVPSAWPTSYPGLASPGFIEAEFRFYDGVHATHYPGLASPGFIEASSMPAMRSRLRSLSGVGQPRLH